MKKAELITTVRGIDIKTNTIYTITAADDSTSPMETHKKTKNVLLPHGDRIGMIFAKSDIEYNSGVYDTGFYVESPRYHGYPPTTIKTIVDRLCKYIKEPYEKLKYRDLSSTNLEFWDNYGVFVHNNKFFNTENIDHLLAVYTLASSPIVGPKDGNYEVYNHAIVYELEDEACKVSHEEEVTNLEFETIGIFRELLRTNKTLLINILRYSGLTSGIVKETNDNTLSTSFKKWIEVKEGNRKEFLAAYKIATQESNGEELLETYSACLTALDNRLITFKNNAFYFENNELGLTLKEAASKLLQKSMEKVRVKLLKVL